MSNDLLIQLLNAGKSTAIEKPQRDESIEQAAELHPYARRAVEGEIERLRALPDPWHEGAGWDITTFEVACNLIEIANNPKAGYTHDHAWSDLITNAPRDYEWGERQIEAKWHSAKARVRDAIREIPEGHFAAPEVGTFRRVTQEEETDFWDSEPFLKHIRSSAYARTVSPWAVLGFTLARCAVATHYSIGLPPIIGSKASLNTFVGLVGPSGSGKNAAMAVAEEIYDFGDPIYPRRVASGEAMARLFKHRETGNPEPVWNTDLHAELIVEDEIDRLTGLSGRQGSTIMADLRSAWSGGPLGQVAMDGTRSMPVEGGQYRLALVAGIQPGRAGGLLDDAAGGTPQRFLWMPSTDPNIPDYEEDEEDEIKPLVRKTWPGLDMKIIGKQNCCLTVAKPIRTLIKSTQRKAVQGQSDNALDGHALLVRLKVAALISIMGGKCSIGEHEWDLAGTIMDKSDETRGQVQQALLDEKIRASRAIAEAKAYEAVQVDAKRHESMLEKAKKRIITLATAPTPRRDLHMRLSKPQREFFAEAIDELLRDQALVETEPSTYMIKTA